MKVSRVRRAGEILGREGISKRIIELVGEFDGSYKGAVNLAGRLSVLASACGFDDYWEQKARLGIQSECCVLEMIIEEQPNE